ncbi:hypothetical protein EGW08_020874 [Elysia chlorotica]|uniref:Ionotropic glutamate receptor C-terminal domain-containing protein n=1 Tax=Elysia chlorotica TaxID=188477 RepID=A0A3S0ZBU1_ELYCH|nr:hypothetical protein EGW08_020874 [Elysia chlorotica]
MLFGASVSTDQPRGCASRFLANIWALFAVVFCASYTANLAAFMITKDDFYDLSGIQDWRLKNPNHQNPPFKFATIEKSATDLNIANNYKEIHMYMKQNPQTDVKTAITKLKTNQIQAFIYDSTTLEYEVGKDDGCKLKTVGKRISETGYGIAFPKKSQWTQQINKALLVLQQDGEIERLKKFWLAGACHKKKETGVSSHTLGILNFTSAFILLGAGVVFGVVLLIMEHCYFRFGRKSLKRWDKCGCCSLVSLSMGQSLTFEQSVMEAIDFHRQHKCKDPLCETQLWKAKHELDLALLKVGQLRKQLAHNAALEASIEDMNLPETVDESSSPHQNGSASRRRRRQRDGDEADGRSQNRTADTRQPLLALEAARSDTESDDDRPTGGSPRRPVARPPRSAHVEFAPSRGPNGVAARGHPDRQGAVPAGAAPGRRSGEITPQQSADDKAKPSRHAQQQQPSSAGSGRPSPTDGGIRSGNPDGEDDQLASYPPPPPFEEVLASEGYRYPRSPESGRNGVPDSSALHSPSLTPPPPPHVPPSSTDLFDLGSIDRQLPAAPDSSGQGTGRFPPPPTQSPERGQDSPVYSRPHRPSSVRTPPSANTVPKSSVHQDTSSDRPLTSSFEDDNDRSLRRQRSNDNNMYVNVDNIVGKETYF